MYIRYIRYIHRKWHDPNVFRPVLLRQFPPKKTFTTLNTSKKKSTCVVVVVYFEEKTDQKSGNNSGGSGGGSRQNTREPMGFREGLKTQNGFPSVKNEWILCSVNLWNQGFGQSPKLWRSWRKRHVFQLENMRKTIYFPLQLWRGFLRVEVDCDVCGSLCSSGCVLNFTYFTWLAPFKRGVPKDLQNPNIPHDMLPSMMSPFHHQSNCLLRFSLEDLWNKKPTESLLLPIASIWDWYIFP